jgi:serine/threonine-protein kinase
VSDASPALDAAPDAERGRVIAGRYRLCDVLGEGASGVVWIAERTGDGEGEPAAAAGAGRVALKVIHRHLLGDRQIHRRFQREARLLQRLRGEHLVPILDYGEDEGGVLYMALELVDGAPLDELMRSGPMPAERAVRLLRQVCEGLSLAHAAGVVHRDLKPGNVLVERAGSEDERARVVDFGMAKALRGDTTSDSLSALTQQNMVFGTPEYMAPEQARGDEVDARCDVYAAGVMLYELLTGSVPFRSHSPIVVMTAHLTERPEPPSSRRPESRIAPALDAVVLHALSKDPAGRYPTAAALADALGGALCDPRDVASVAPRPSELDLAHRDTDLALQPPAGEAAAAPRAQERGTSRLWLWVAIVATLVGIAIGLIAGGHPG